MVSITTHNSTIVVASVTNQLDKDSPSHAIDMPSNTSKAPASSNASHDMLISTAFLGYHTTTVTDSAASTAPHTTSVLTSALDPIYSTTCAMINIHTSTDDGTIGSVGATNNNTTITDLIGPNSSDDIDTSVDADIITAPHAASVLTSASEPNIQHYLCHDQHSY
jgi:hypothetical protein